VPHKLLLADDSVTIQRVIELTFADEDVQVIAVGNGADAIERAQRDRPDIVLADVGMPERDGYEVAQFVKGTPELAHIPVVLLTGAFEPVDENRARAVGCDGVLVKPFEPQLVISRVKDLLAGKRPAGMWGGGPVAQGPVRQAPAAPDAGDLRGAAAVAQSSESLDAYFDHLDAAFGGPDAQAGRQAADPAIALRAPAPVVPSVPTAAAPTAPSAPAAAAPAVPGAGDPFANWDPDLQGDPSRLSMGRAPVAPAAPLPGFIDPQLQTPAAVPADPGAPIATEPRSAVAAPEPRSAILPVPQPVAPAAPISPEPRSGAGAPEPQNGAGAPGPIPSLVDAFTALLSAELNTGLTPAAGAAPASAPAAVVTDEMIEAIAARVLARLSDDVRPSILAVAERLVREEIERIKSIG